MGGLSVEAQGVRWSVTRAGPDVRCRPANPGQAAQWGPKSHLDLSIDPSLFELARKQDRWLSLACFDGLTLRQRLADHSDALLRETSVVSGSTKGSQVALVHARGLNWICTLCDGEVEVEPEDPKKAERHSMPVSIVLEVDPSELEWSSTAKRWATHPVISGTTLASAITRVCNGEPVDQRRRTEAAPQATKADSWRRLAK